MIDNISRFAQSGRSMRTKCDANAPTFLSAVYINSTQTKKRQAGAPQYGRSMIEMLGVLAIIGVLSVGGIAGYTKAMMKSKVNSTVETMLTIASNVRTLTLRTKNYDNLAKVAIKMKAIPEKALNGSSLGANTFGGSVGLGEFYNKSFYVAMNGLPREACVEIASKDFGSALVYAGDGDFGANKLSSLENTNLKFANPACSSAAPYYCLKKPMSPATAAQACSCAVSSGCSVALIMF